MFYWFGVPDKIVKLFFILCILLTLFFERKRIVFYRFHLILLIFIITVFFSFSEVHQLWVYGYPFIILVLSSFLFSIYKNIPEIKVKKILKNLVVIAFVAIVFKLFLHGIDEKYLIGFMSMTAGELGFLFPAFMLVFVLEIFPNNKERLAWFMTLALFGILNEKRSIALFLPLIFILNLPIRSLINIKNLSFVFAVYCAGISLIPSLNRENKIGGSIDLIYPVEYAIEYMTATYDGGIQGDSEWAKINKGAQYGRVALLGSIISEYADLPLNRILFGYGMGTFTINHSVDNILDDNMFKIFSFRGTLSTALVLLLDSGLISLVFYILFMLNYLRKIRIKFISYFPFLLIISYDVFLYSQSILKTLPISIYFFTLVPLVLYRLKTFERESIKSQIE